MIIKYLKHIEINKNKWNECIVTASNSLIFAFSFYLDIMAPNWDAIIINDYEFVLPLPIKKKWGIKYIYIPPFIPQLGLFGKNPTLNIDNLLPLLNSKVNYGDIFFNHHNRISSSLVKQRTNFILHLKKDYEHIYKNYATDLKRILRKQVKNEMLYSKQNTIEYTINLYKENYAHRTPHLSNSDYKIFLDACNMLNTTENCFTRSICTSDESILCSLICLADENRIYTIINPSTILGRQKEAAIFLFDELIREFSETDKVLDFVGSDLAGVKFFLNKYGPIDEPIFFYHFNYLPYPARFFKNSFKSIKNF